LDGTKSKTDWSQWLFYEWGGKESQKEGRQKEKMGRKNKGKKIGENGGKRKRRWEKWKKDRGKK
jgi:hypothetical protein